MTRVLIIDDEPAIRLLARLNLEAEGIEVLEAGDGESGLQQALSERPDLILLDVVMPRLDGLQVAERLRREARTRDIPIVFMSGLGELAEEPVARREELLVKPFDPLELSRRVVETLRRHRASAGA
jgi:two-component system alkaline phosphatase synthesis response regulator PhoP